MRWILAIAVLALILTSVLAACSGAAKQEPAASSTLDGEALVEERCSTCHGLDRVTSASKTRDEWQANVERMVNNGAELNEAEQEAVIDYLAEAYP
jgi:mono/diheme cytochrome c family protein